MKRESWKEREKNRERPGIREGQRTWAVFYSASPPAGQLTGPGDILDSSTVLTALSGRIELEWATMTATVDPAAFVLQVNWALVGGDSGRWDLDCLSLAYRPSGISPAKR